MQTSPPLDKTTDVREWIAARLTGLDAPPDDKVLEEISAVLEGAMGNLSSENPGHVDPYKGSVFDRFENATGFRIAIDPGTFQVICKTEDTSQSGLDWPRFGVSRVNDGQFEAFFIDSMYDPGIDLAEKAPDAAVFLNALSERDTAVVAFLGTARVDADKGIELIGHVHDAVEGLDNVAFMTGGYRGAFDHCYGVTRAGFDVPKSLGRQTVWVMCEAGVKDSSQTPDAKSICGRNWGDDTPAMEACSDGAIFFRNIPAGKMYGAWTEVEIANFVASPRDKPIAIVDPSATEPHERLFGRDVPLFHTGAQAAAYLGGRLDAVRKRRQTFQVSEMTMRTIQRGRPQDDIQMVSIIDHEGRFHARYVPLAPQPEVMTAWAAVGLDVPTEYPDQWTFTRACWQDLIMLEAAGLLKQPMGGSRDEILALPTAGAITAYAALRAKVQTKLDAGNAPFTPTRTCEDANGETVWFLHEADSTGALLDCLKS